VTSGRGKRSSPDARHGDRQNLLLRLAVDVAGGKLAFGIADTDNPLEEIRGGQPVEIV
jgi:hypothetical protein